MARDVYEYVNVDDTIYHIRPLPTSEDQFHKCINQSVQGTRTFVMKEVPGYTMAPSKRGR